MRGNPFHKIGTLVRPGTLLMGLAVPAWTLVASPSINIAETAPERQEIAGATMWVATTQRLKTKVYENRSLTASPILIVVVHGDSPDGPRRTNTDSPRQLPQRSLTL
jgi:hypothetical protein